MLLLGLVLAALCRGWGAAAARHLDTPLRLEAQDAADRLGELVIPFGYPLEQHAVRTRDGYILGCFRLPFGAEGRRRGDGLRGDDAPRPVVLLAHGLLDTAAGFLVNGPTRSLAFILADAGYDVWLLNSRGSTLSRQHAWLRVEDEQFWMFSYDEMARLDLPAVVDYILDATGASSIVYVGHSQGTTVLLAALSSQPRLNQLIRRAVLLAPVAVAKHIASVPLVTMAALGTDNIFALMGVHEFMPSQELIAQLEGQMCRSQPLLCLNILAAIAGYNPDNLDTAKLPLYLSYTPGGTSVQNMAHWAQAVRSRAPNTMSWFDYGTDCSDGRRCNQLRYGQATPPLYNLTAITTPLAIFSGRNDRLSTPLDVEYLLESLHGGVAGCVVDVPTYEHLDFIWGIDAYQALYPAVLDFLAAAGPGSGGDALGADARAADAVIASAWDGVMGGI